MVIWRCGRHLCCALGQPQSRTSKEKGTATPPNFSLFKNSMSERYIKLSARRRSEPALTGSHTAVDESLDAELDELGNERAFDANNVAFGGVCSMRVALLSFLLTLLISVSWAAYRRAAHALPIGEQRCDMLVRSRVPSLHAFVRTLDIDHFDASRVTGGANATAWTLIQSFVREPPECGDDALRRILQAYEASDSLPYSAWISRLPRSVELSMFSNHDACRWYETVRRVDSSLLPLLRSLLDYARTLHSSFVVPHRKHANATIDSPAVLVVGGGPIGLASALQAYRSGATRLVVVEKRTQYTRDIWFDLYPSPWSRALEWLRDCADKHVFRMEVVRHEESDAVTLRANILERFLAAAVVALNIDIRYGWQLIDLCEQAPNDGERDGGGGGLWSGDALVVPRVHAAHYGQRYEDDANANDVEVKRGHACARVQSSHWPQRIAFDILVGCDGSSSVVRRLASIRSQRQNSFRFLGNLYEVHIPGIRQPTTIVNFRTVGRAGNRTCPQLATNADGYAYDARYPGFVLDTVTNVYKRFYKEHCHMQILWNVQHGNRIDATFARGDVPWDDLLSVARLLLADAPRNVPHLKRMIARRRSSHDDADERDGGDQDGARNYQIDNVAIHIDASVPVNTLQLTRETADADMAPAVNENSGGGGPIVTLSGDALSRAHYRLGIGINNGLSSLHELDALIRSVSVARSVDWSRVSLRRELMRVATETKQADASLRLRKLVQYQLSVMFYESYCDFSIYFDMSQDDVFRTPVVYAKERREPIDYFAGGPLSPEEARDKCQLYLRTDEEAARIVALSKQLEYDRQLAQRMNLEH